MRLLQVIAAQVAPQGDRLDLSVARVHLSEQMNAMAE
jgi:hypothetical protein